ncbi:MAG: UDP-N-acetylmuramoylalanine--D-glutamate ligase [Rhodospirillales bacterium 69-11]|nr:MAG: UDP-N-acetylmuramoylalanine--D-glutamate ligase [Rhodospirillales bacterium 69-11]
MSTFPHDLFAGQRFAVVGLGKNGLPAAQALRAMGAEVTAWDDQPASRAAAQAAEIDLPLRDLREGAFAFDALVLSPGIPHLLPTPHPIAQRAREAGVPILSDAELLFRAVRAAGSRARFVGITGTNGKSTTTALLAHVLAEAGVPVAAGGNLGPAALSLPLLPHDGVYVLEMSSYMLERIATMRFDAAAMLNLSADHLDRHGDMTGYARAKRAIFDRQTDADLAVIGVDDALSREMAAALRAGPARVVRVSGVAQAAQSHAGPALDVSSWPSSTRPSLRQGAAGDGRVEPGHDDGNADIHPVAGILQDAAGPLFRLADAQALPGAHNAQNAAAVAAMALFLGISRTDLAHGLATYPGLPHRQQLVATIDGVRFINDSKATNADATERALVCYDRLVWIAGGMAKEGGIAPLVPLFPRIARALLIGRDAPVLAETLAANGVPHETVGTLEAAVPAAFAAARTLAAHVVLLSPACASWDQFTGYDQRGDRFADLARGLSSGRAA